MPVIIYYGCCNCDKPLKIRDKTKLFCEECSVIEVEYLKQWDNDYLRPWRGK